MIDIIFWKREKSALRERPGRFPEWRGDDAVSRCFCVREKGGEGQLRRVFKTFECSPVTKGKRIHISQRGGIMEEERGSAGDRFLRGRARLGAPWHWRGRGVVSRRGAGVCGRQFHSHQDRRDPSVLGKLQGHRRPGAGGAGSGYPPGRRSVQGPQGHDY